MADPLPFTPRTIEHGDREPCENCELEFDIDVMRLTDDGVWLCDGCYEECAAATAAAADDDDGDGWDDPEGWE